MRRLVVAPVLVLTTFLVVAASMFTAGALEDSFERLLPLADLERKGVVYFEDLDAFAVTTRRGPLVLKLRHPIDGHWHMPDTAVYCKSARIFESNDSWFDRQGRYLAGPAIDSLERIATRTSSDGWVMVDPAQVSPGPRRHTLDAFVLREPSCRAWGGTWKEVAPHVATAIR